MKNSLKKTQRDAHREAEKQFQNYKSGTTIHPLSAAWKSHKLQPIIKNILSEFVTSSES